MHQYCLLGKKYPLNRTLNPHNTHTQGEFHPRWTRIRYQTAQLYPPTCAARGGCTALRTDDDELSVARLSRQLGHGCDDLGRGGDVTCAALGCGNDNGLGAHLGGGDGTARLGHGQHGGWDGLDQCGDGAGCCQLWRNKGFVSRFPARTWHCC